ncbi:MAG TPA: hypothetical protein VI731_03915 [Bacteroidia bacterium]|nr:hypothetical protein [Bacteroidia bacterium]
MTKKNENPELKPVYHISENFSSVFLGAVPEHLRVEEKNVDQGLTQTILSFLEARNNDLKQEFLAALRNNNAGELLVLMLQTKAHAKHTKELLVTCWETGIDFSPWIEFFVEYLFHKDPAIAIEAITVIEEMAGPFSPEIITKVNARLADLPQNHTFYPLVASIRRKLG